MIILMAPTGRGRTADPLLLANSKTSTCWSLSPTRITDCLGRVTPVDRPSPTLEPESTMTISRTPARYKKRADMHPAMPPTEHKNDNIKSQVCHGLVQLFTSQSCLYSSTSDSLRLLIAVCAHAYLQQSIPHSHLAQHSSVIINNVKLSDVSLLCIVRREHTHNC